MGARPSGRFSVNEPTRLASNERCGTSESEAASTPRSNADNLWTRGTQGETPNPNNRWRDKWRTGRFLSLEFVAWQIRLDIH